MFDPEAKLLAILDTAEEYRGLAMRAKDRSEREAYERIVEIAEELEWLIATPAISRPPPSAT